MIPLKDQNPSKSIPFVNIALILINISIFLYQYFFYSEGPELMFLRLGFLPYEFTHMVDISPENLIPVPLTMFSAMFMHAGWLHLLSNMLYLWIFGDNVEDILGHRRYLFFYLFCGIAATLIHGFMNVNSKIPTVGASGAIAGVLGAYICLFPKARVQTLIIIIIFFRIVRIPSVVLLGYWILIQVVSGMAEMEAHTGGGVAWFAHIGGFFTGLVLIMGMKKKRRPTSR